MSVSKGYYLPIKSSFNESISYTLQPYRVAGNFELTAASTFAGLSSLGSASILMTEMRMVSTVCTGSQRSEAFS